MSLNLATAKRLLISMQSGSATFVAFTPLVILFFLDMKPENIYGEHVNVWY
jgi:hypothetical protein